MEEIDDNVVSKQPSTEEIKDIIQPNWVLTISVVALLTILLYWVFMVIFVGGFDLVDTPHGMTVAAWWLIIPFIISAFCIGGILDSK